MEEKVKELLWQLEHSANHWKNASEELKKRFGEFDTLYLRYKDTAEAYQDALNIAKSIFGVE